MKNLKNYCVSYSNNQERDAIVEFYKRMVGTDEVETSVLNSGLKIVGLKTGTDDVVFIGGYPGMNEKTIPFNELHTLLLGNYVSVKLNDEYTAEVSKKGIKVGCQTFSFEAFNKLAEAVKRITAE